MSDKDQSTGPEDKAEPPAAAESAEAQTTDRKQAGTADETNQPNQGGGVSEVVHLKLMKRVEVRIR